MRFCVHIIRWSMVNMNIGFVKQCILRFLRSSANRISCKAWRISTTVLLIWLQIHLCAAACLNMAAACIPFIFVCIILYLTVPAGVLLRKNYLSYMWVKNFLRFHLIIWILPFGSQKMLLQPSRKRSLGPCLPTVFRKMKCRPMPIDLMFYLPQMRS